MNDYQFVPGSSGGCDILLSTRIGKRENANDPEGEGDLPENATLAKGSTRFTYNGINYVPVGGYYDYQSKAQNLCGNF